jgi:hypothetical protein
MVLHSFASCEVVEMVREIIRSSVLIRMSCAALGLASMVACSSTSVVHGVRLVDKSIDRGLGYETCGDIAEETTFYDTKYPAGSHVCINESSGCADCRVGRVRSVRFSVPQTVRGVLYETTVGDCLALGDDGSVNSGTLAQPTRVGTVVLPRGTSVATSAEGEIKRARLKEALTVADVVYCHEVRFSQGKLRGGMLCDDARLPIGRGTSVKFKKGTYVDLFSDGGVQNGTLAQYYCIDPGSRKAWPCPYDNIGYRPGTEVEFDSEGRLTSPRD